MAIIKAHFHHVRHEFSLNLGGRPLDLDVPSFARRQKAGWGDPVQAIDAESLGYLLVIKYPGSDRNQRDQKG